MIFKYHWVLNNYFLSLVLINICLWLIIIAFNIVRNALSFQIRLAFCYLYLCLVFPETWVGTDTSRVSEMTRKCMHWSFFEGIVLSATLTGYSWKMYFRPSIFAKSSILCSRDGEHQSIPSQSIRTLKAYQNGSWDCKQNRGWIFSFHDCIITNDSLD